MVLVVNAFDRASDRAGVLRTGREPNGRSAADIGNGLHRCGAQAPVAAILRAAGERLAAPLDVEADRLAGEQNARDAELGLTPSPCGGADQLRRKGADIRAASTGAPEGAPLAAALKMLGAEELAD